MVALAETLIAREHLVSLAVPPNAMKFVQEFGLDCFPVGIDYEEVSRRGASGTLRTCTLRIRSRPLMSGLGTTT